MLWSLSQVWCKWWLWKSHVCAYATHGVDIKFNSNIFKKENVSFVGHKDLGQLQLLEYKRSLKMQNFIVMLFLNKMQLMIIDHANCFCNLKIIYISFFLSLTFFHNNFFIF